MVWLVGNKGMLGTELAGLLTEKGLPLVGTDRELSILEPGALHDFARDKNIRWILNCAAYTAVDRAEDEPGLARSLNVEGPRNLARLARELGASLLHVSTDYVFSGAGTRPYAEDDPVGPTGVYGRTKAEGEAAALGNCSRTVILRTAWLYGKHGPNFVSTMLRLMKEKERIGVVADQRGSPTWAADLSEAILRIITRPEPRYGIYHYTDSGETTWFEFAQAIERLGRESGLLSRPCAVEALTTAQYPTKTIRPAYSVLGKEKILRDYGIRPPAWRESLAQFMESIDIDAPRVPNTI